MYTDANTHITSQHTLSLSSELVGSGKCGGSAEYSELELILYVMSCNVSCPPCFNCNQTSQQCLCGDA